MIARLGPSGYKNRRVLVTGNTGFKGSWLVLWLKTMGAEVCGYSVGFPTQPNHHEILALNCETVLHDIRNLNEIQQVVKNFHPDIIFHLAAQSLVRKSYQSPVETFETNVMGTVNLFEACRRAGSVKAIINVTSDKCYENQEWVWGYRENDPLGGHDPYSASKGCAEFIASSYQRSFFPLDQYQKSHQTLIANVRAGNVIGGGDWGRDRLIPDIIRAAVQGEPVQIRSPRAIRPWQHVLEPLSGYLLLGQHLLEGRKEFSGAWNFGPSTEGETTVLNVIERLQNHWPGIKYSIERDAKNPHEAQLLKLDCSKAAAKIQWKPVWDAFTALGKTAQWYKDYYESGSILSRRQLTEYINDANKKQMSWTNQ
jgi:CDP-glucose 4,6-dehydratase